MASNSTAPNAPQSRSRVTVVCAECKRLKLKCDRRSPCGSCLKRDCVPRCTYTPAAAEKVDVPSLNNRLMSVEGELRRVSRATGGAWVSVFPPGGAGAEGRPAGGEREGVGVQMESFDASSSNTPQRHPPPQYQHNFPASLPPTLASYTLLSPASTASPFVGSLLSLNLSQDGAAPGTRTGTGTTTTTRVKLELDDPTVHAYTSISPPYPTSTHPTTSTSTSTLPRPTLTSTTLLLPAYSIYIPPPSIAPPGASEASRVGAAFPFSGLHSGTGVHAGYGSTSSHPPYSIHPTHPPHASSSTHPPTSTSTSTPTPTPNHPIPPPLLALLPCLPLFGTYLGAAQRALEGAGLLILFTRRGGGGGGWKGWERFRRRAGRVGRRSLESSDSALRDAEDEGFGMGEDEDEDEDEDGEDGQGREDGHESLPFFALLCAVLSLGALHSHSDSYPHTPDDQALQDALFLFLLSQQALDVWSTSHSTSHTSSTSPNTNTNTNTNTSTSPSSHSVNSTKTKSKADDEHDGQEEEDREEDTTDALRACLVGVRVLLGLCRGSGTRLGCGRREGGGYGEAREREKEVREVRQDVKKAGRGLLRTLLATAHLLEVDSEHGVGRRRGARTKSRSTTKTGNMSERKRHKHRGTRGLEEEDDEDDDDDDDDEEDEEEREEKEKEKEWKRTLWWECVWGDVTLSDALHIHPCIALSVYSARMPLFALPLGLALGEGRSTARANVNVNVDASSWLGNGGERMVVDEDGEHDDGDDGEEEEGRSASASGFFAEFESRPSGRLPKRKEGGKDGAVRGEEEKEREGREEEEEEEDGRYAGARYRLAHLIHTIHRHMLAPPLLPLPLPFPRPGLSVPGVSGLSGVSGLYASLPFAGPPSLMGPSGTNGLNGMGVVGGMGGMRGPAIPSTYTLDQACALDACVRGWLGSLALDAVSDVSASSASFGVEGRGEAGGDDVDAEGEGDEGEGGGGRDEGGSGEGEEQEEGYIDPLLRAGSGGVGSGKGRQRSRSRTLARPQTHARTQTQILARNKQRTQRTTHLVLLGHSLLLSVWVPFVSIPLTVGRGSGAGNPYHHHQQQMQMQMHHQSQLAVQQCIRAAQDIVGLVKGLSAASPISTLPSTSSGSASTSTATRDTLNALDDANTPAETLYAACVVLAWGAFSGSSSSSSSPPSVSTPTSSRSERREREMMLEDLKEGLGLLAPAPGGGGSFGTSLTRRQRGVVDVIWGRVGGAGADAGVASGTRASGGAGASIAVGVSGGASASGGAQRKTQGKRKTAPATAASGVGQSKGPTPGRKRKLDQVDWVGSSGPSTTSIDNLHDAGFSNTNAIHPTALQTNVNANVAANASTSNMNMNANTNTNTTSPSDPAVNFPIPPNPNVHGVHGMTSADYIENAHAANMGANTNIGTPMPMPMPYEFHRQIDNDGSLYYTPAAAPGGVGAQVQTPTPMQTQAPMPMEVQDQTQFLDMGLGMGVMSGVGGNLDMNMGGLGGMNVDVDVGVGYGMGTGMELEMMGAGMGAGQPAQIGLQGQVPPQVQSQAQTQQQQQQAQIQQAQQQRLHTQPTPHPNARSHPYNQRGRHVHVRHGSGSGGGAGSGGGSGAGSGHPPHPRDRYASLPKDPFAYISKRASDSSQGSASSHSDTSRPDVRQRLGRRHKHEIPVEFGIVVGSGRRGDAAGRESLSEGEGEEEGQGQEGVKDVRGGVGPGAVSAGGQSAAQLPTGKPLSTSPAAWKSLGRKLTKEAPYRVTEVPQKRSSSPGDGSTAMKMGIGMASSSTSANTNTNAVNPGLNSGFKLHRPLTNPEERTRISDLDKLLRRKSGGNAPAGDTASASASTTALAPPSATGSVCLEALGQMKVKTQTSGDDAVEEVATPVHVARSMAALPSTSVSHMPSQGHGPNFNQQLVESPLSLEHGSGPATMGGSVSGSTGGSVYSRSRSSSVSHVQAQQHQHHAQQQYQHQQQYDPYSSTGGQPIFEQQQRQQQQQYHQSYTHLSPQTHTQGNSFDASYGGVDSSVYGTSPFSAVSNSPPASSSHGHASHTQQGRMQPTPTPPLFGPQPSTPAQSHSSVTSASGQAPAPGPSSSPVTYFPSPHVPYAQTFEQNPMAMSPSMPGTPVFEKQDASVYDAYMLQRQQQQQQPGQMGYQHQGTGNVSGYEPADGQQRMMDWAPNSAGNYWQGSY